MNWLRVFNKKNHSEIAAKIQPKAPDIARILPVLSVEELLNAHAGKITSLNELAGLSESNFTKYYRPCLHNFARVVQLLPASEIHHHASPGGMLEHTLDACVTA